MADEFNDSRHAHEKFTTFTHTLAVKGPNNDYSDSELNNSAMDYVVEFLTENEYPVQFQADIMGEKLGKAAQVSISETIARENFPVHVSTCLLE